MKKYFYLLLNLIIMLSVVCSNQTLVFADTSLDEQLVEITCTIDDLSAYDSLTTYASNFLLCSSTNNKIADLKDNTTYFSQDGLLDGKISTPTYAKRLNDSTIAVYDAGERVQFFDNNFNLTKVYRTTQSQKLGNVVSLSTDYTGNIFMLDMTNNNVLEIKKDNEYILKIDISGLTIGLHDKIAVNANGDKIAIKSDAEVTIYDLQQSTSQQINISCDDIVFDYLNNLFCLNNSTTTVLKKYSAENYTFVVEKSFSTSYTSVSLDIETGTFYVLSDKIYSFAPSNFAENASQATAPIDIKSTTMLNDEVIFYKSKIGAKLFATCVSFSSSDTLEAGTLIVALKDDIEQNENMVYVITNIGTSQKLGYVDKQYIEKQTLTETETTYSTICQNVDILTYPTALSGICKNIGTEKTNIIVINTACNYVDCNGNTFYAVKTADGIGYVKQNYLAKSGDFESVAIEKMPQNNNSSQFVAFIMVVVCLLIVITFAVVFINKKHKSN